MEHRNYLTCACGGTVGLTWSILPDPFELGGFVGPINLVCLECDRLFPITLVTKIGEHQRMNAGDKRFKVNKAVARKAEPLDLRVM